MPGIDREWRDGGRVLFAAAVGVGVGIPALINCASLFIVPMQQEFGWSRSAVAIGPIVGLIYSILNPIGGMVIDRVGARRAAIAGLIVLSALLLALAAVPVQKAVFYSLLILFGVIGTVTNNVVFCKAVATWFRRNAGASVALVLTGVSVMGALTQPVLAQVIANYGWRMGYVMLAAMALLIGLPVVLIWFREQTENARLNTAQPGNVEGASLAEAMRDKRFWLIVAAFGSAAVPIGGFVSQMQPLLLGKGFASAAAASLVSVFLVATGIGRIAAGILFDHFRPPVVAALFLGVSALGALLLGTTDATTSWLAIAFALTLIGLAQGAEGDFIALFVLRIFGVQHFSALFATMAMVAGITFAAGGFLFAAVFDRNGNYTVAVLAAAAVLLLAALIALTVRVPPAAAAS